MTIKDVQPVEVNLSGAEIIDRLRRGHMVARACWQENFAIRICNESGYDSDGYAVYDERDTLYTIATDGYFMHLAYSSQPYKEAHVFHDGQVWQEASRDGEGVAMLFASDWMDYGFISKKDFDKLTAELKEGIRSEHKKIVKNKIRAVAGDSDQEDIE